MYSSINRECGRGERTGRTVPGKNGSSSAQGQRSEETYCGVKGYLRSRPALERGLADITRCWIPGDIPAVRSNGESAYRWASPDQDEDQEPPCTKRRKTITAHRHTYRESGVPGKITNPNGKYEEKKKWRDWIARRKRTGQGRPGSIDRRSSSLRLSRAGVRND